MSFGNRYTGLINKYRDHLPVFTRSGRNHQQNSRWDGLVRRQSRRLTRNRRAAV